MGCVMKKEKKKEGYINLWRERERDDARDDIAEYPEGRNARPLDFSRPMCARMYYFVARRPSAACVS